MAGTAAADAGKDKIAFGLGTPTRGQGPGDHQPELIDIDGLDQVIVGPPADGLLAGIDGGEGRDQDYDRVGMFFPGGVEDVQAGLVAAEIEVGDDQVKAAAVDLSQGVFGGIGRNRRSLSVQGLDEDIGMVLFIVHNQNGGVGFHCPIHLSGQGGKVDPKTGSLSGLRSDGDRTAMGGDDFPGGGQPQTASGRLCCIICQEDFVKVLRLDPATGIGHLYEIQIACPVRFVGSIRLRWASPAGR